MSARRLRLADARIEWSPAYLPLSEAERLFDSLREQVRWRQDEVIVFGRRYRTPRLQCWIGDPGCSYGYSGLTLEPEPFPDCVRELRHRLEASHGIDFNCVLLNLYRDGKDSVGWHSDDEAQLGPNPTIASISLGAPRRFRLRHRRHPELTHSLDLGPGDLLLMRPPTQRFWQHQIPKSRRPVGPRINLSFRRIG